MHVSVPQRRQVYSRPDSSTTASRAAPLSGHGRRDRRYALVATVDHRDGPEGPSPHPGLRFARTPWSIPAHPSANMPAGNHDGDELASNAAHRLSTAAHNLPGRGRDGPSSSCRPTRAAPRTDPSGRNYRTGLLPRVRASKRSSGHGCRIRARGIHRRSRTIIRVSVIRSRWLRRRSALCQ